MKKCNNCGKITDSKFCPDCGLPLEECKEVCICPVCGEIVETKFCPNCGKIMEPLKKDGLEVPKDEDALDEEIVNKKDAIDEYVVAKEIDSDESLYTEIDEEATATETTEMPNNAYQDNNIYETTLMNNTNTLEKAKTYQKTWFVILMLIILFPVGLYLMWKHNKFKKVIRIIITIVLGLNFLFNVLVFIALLMPCQHENTSTYISSEATLTKSGTEVKYCTDCKEDLDSWEIDEKNPDVDYNSFNFEDEEFIDWINEISTAEISHTELDMEWEDVNNTSYRVTMSDGDTGAVILNHDKDDKISAIMVYFDEYATASALATFFATKIDSSFSSDAAFAKLVDYRDYTQCDMTIMRLKLDDDFEVTVLAPEAYIDEISD